MRPETSDEEILRIREKLRLARDHMNLAQREFESALTHIGRGVASWYFCLPEPCDCGVTPTVSVLEIYEWFTSLTNRCNTLFRDTDESTKELRVKMQKRGSKRKDYVDLGNGHIEPMTTRESVFQEVFPDSADLKIEKAPKED